MNKIAVTGPESCGKTTLTLKLQKHFKLPIVEDYSRIHFSNNPLNHSIETIYAIAKEQIKLENDFSILHEQFICDTDLINIKIWLNYYGHPIPTFIKDHLANKPYSYSLLLYPDLPWINDGLRENKHDRISLFKQFEHELKSANSPYTIIRGEGELRNQLAIKALEGIFN